MDAPTSMENINAKLKSTLGKQWTVYLKPHTIFQKLRWRLFGTLPVIFVDNIKLGPQGFMALIDEDNDQSWMEWNFNLQSWTCNWGFTLSEANVKKQRTVDRQQEVMDAMFPLGDNTTDGNMKTKKEPPKEIIRDGYQ